MLRYLGSPDSLLSACCLRLLKSTACVFICLCAVLCSHRRTSHVCQVRHCCYGCCSYWQRDYCESRQGCTNFSNSIGMSLWASVSLPGGRSLYPVKTGGRGICRHQKRCFSSKCSTNRLVAGLYPDLLGTLTVLLQTS